jgi:hypothetical protein
LLHGGVQRLPDLLLNLLALLLWCGTRCRGRHRNLVVHLGLDRNHRGSPELFLDQNPRDCHHNEQPQDAEDGFHVMAPDTVMPDLLTPVTMVATIATAPIPVAQSQADPWVIRALHINRVILLGHHNGGWL